MLQVNKMALLNGHYSVYHIKWDSDCGRDKQ